MFFNERYELSLAVLMLYLGCLDGYLKLNTGWAPMTLVRDGLLFAVVGGILVRKAFRHERLDLPPLSVW